MHRALITGSRAYMLGSRHHAVRGLLRASPSPRTSFLSNQELARDIRFFSASSMWCRKQDSPSLQQQPDEKPPPTTIRSKARQTSLRSVGIAAAKKRQIIQDKGGVRIIDPDIETKVGCPPTHCLHEMIY